MLLRIIDNPAADNTKYSVRIILENKGKAESFVTETYTSPITANFRKTLEWYFKDYIQSVTGTDDSSVVEKLIKCGQYIGDGLLGEDHQLIKLREEIEKQGYENLQVQIESERVEFFKELWETTILPESKYVLSAVVKSYVRQFVQEDFPNDYPELRYDLKVPPPSQDKIAKLLQSDDVSIADHKPEHHKPLRILYLVSRPEAFELPFNSSNSINLDLEAIASGGAIDYEIHPLIDWEQLQNKLADKNRPVHILHYDGPIILENDIASILLTNSSATDSFISINELSKVLAKNKVGGLCIDARIYLQNNQPIPAAEGLANIAHSAHQHGLGNVIGLAQITNPWTSGQCFQAVYSKIARGLSLEQAVVEARKGLQSMIQISSMTVKPIPFHPWSLLIHYSKQSVTFFESPQTLTDSNDSPELFRDKLFGFRTEMLPPLLNQVGDGQVLPLVAQLVAAQESGSSQAVSITGETGTGKSQLAHVASLYFAQKQQIDFGFYFNFSNNYYSPNDMLEMIAPLVDLEVDQKTEVEEKLTQLHCCFVLDDVLDRESQQQGIKESWEQLNAFLQKLISCGHIIIIISESYSVLNELAAIKIETRSLPLIEQKIIAVDGLRQLNLTEINQNKDWESLLTSLHGHPWLTKKIMPLLHSYSANELITQVAQHINNKQDGSLVERFYEWQWAGLKPIWQQLLILCSDARGLLLEMVMTAADQKEPFQPAKNLFALLGETEAKFADGLELWEFSGFLSRLPHGRIVDSRCIAFLETKRETCCDSIDEQKLQFYFSQLICEGVRLLTQHVIKQPNPIISNYLLFNRRQWVKHFENLWFSQDYRGFIGVKNTFDQLLLQAKLENESKAWALDLLGRSPVITTNEETSIEAKLCWLLLASSVLDQVEAKNSTCILEGAEIWRTWFNLLADSIDKQHLALFQQAATFLEIFYQSHSNWNDCIAICKKSYTIYTQYTAWQRVIQSLKSLARYHSKLGEKEQTLIFENKIINDIPYADSPPGFQTQQIVDILFARMARTDTRHAQNLLDQLKQEEDAERLADMLDGIQCDIHYHEENYLAALPYYCQIWVRTLQANQQAQIEQLKPRMMELEQKLGMHDFNACFEREAPKGTIKPKDYVSSLH